MNSILIYKFFPNILNSYYYFAIYVVPLRNDSVLQFYGD